MKKLFYLLLTIPFLFFSCENNEIGENESNAVKITSSEKPDLSNSEIATNKDGDFTKIGEIKDNDFVITIDADIIKQKFEKRLKEENNEAILTDFKIESDMMENDEKYYMLIGFNHEKSLKIATFLTLKNNNFYGSIGVNLNTLTCSGCIDGCDPKKGSKGNFCDNSCEECTKTETIGYQDSM